MAAFDFEFEAYIIDPTRLWHHLFFFSEITVEYNCQVLNFNTRTTPLHLATGLSCKELEVRQRTVINNIVYITKVNILTPDFSALSPL